MGSITKRSILRQPIGGQQVRSEHVANTAKRSLEYDAAGTGRRSEGWGTSTRGPNSVLLGNLDILRRRSRQEARTNPHAAAILDCYKVNVVGCGIKPMAKDKALQRLWDAWTDESDASWTTDLYGQQGQALASMLEGGDVFIRLRARDPQRDGLKVPLQLQILEAETVPSALNGQLANGNRIIGGIEHNLIGKPIAYWMHKEHPGDRLWPGIGGDGFDVPALTREGLVRVDAANVIHLRRPGRPGAVRGEPLLARVLVALRELDLYADAEQTRKKVAALFAGFVTTPGTDDDGAVLGTGEAEEAEGVMIQPAEPGSLQVLPPGYEVNWSTPPQDGSYEQFVRAQLRQIATAVGLTYEQLTTDYGQVNDRLFRAALLEVKRRFESLQWEVMVWQMCRPVWRRFVDTVILAGLWTPPAGASEDDIYTPIWTPHAWSYLHPVQDIETTIRAIGAGLTSRKRALSTLGENIDEIDAEIAEDQSRAAALGISAAGYNGDSAQ